MVNPWGFDEFVCKTYEQRGVCVYISLYNEVEHENCLAGQEKTMKTRLPIVPYRWSLGHYK